MRKLSDLLLTLALLGTIPATCLAQCVYRTISVSRVDGAVVGTIADSYGRPIPNVNVELKRHGELVAATTTNESGEFSVSAKPGEYDLHAHTSQFAPGFARIDVRSDFEQTFFPSHLWMILDAGVWQLDQCTLAATSRREFEKTIQEHKKRD
jgi:hypothetical protein